MSQAIHPSAGLPLSHASRDPMYQAYQILHFGFTVAPILAGIDKFFHLMVNWDMYVSPFVNRIVGGHGHEFMYAVGVIEVLAGIGVALWPRVFSYVVALWLLGIVINLLLIPMGSTVPHYDIALRDFGLCLGALALARMSERFAH
jgi:hypothetical protein